MSTSISKNINHPPSGFNPHAPDPASECIVIRGRSISAQSYSPAKNLKMWKPHWWSAFLGTQKTLSCCFFIVFFLSFFKMMNKCEFQRVWRRKKKKQLKLQVPLGVTLSSGKLALSLLSFSKEIQPHNLTDISLSETSLGTQVHPLGAFTNETASPNSKPLPLVSILQFCALLAVKAGAKKVSVCVSACFYYCLCWRPFPLLGLTLKKVSNPVCGLECLQSH